MRNYILNIYIVLIINNSDFLIYSENKLKEFLLSCNGKRIIFPNGSFFHLFQLELKLRLALTIRNLLEFKNPARGGLAGFIQKSSNPRGIWNSFKTQISYLWSSTTLKSSFYWKFNHRICFWSTENRRFPYFV